jgi:hypothetical protein
MCYILGYTVSTPTGSSSDRYNKLCKVTYQLALGAFPTEQALNFTQGTQSITQHDKVTTFKELGRYLFIADLKNTNLCDQTIRLFNSKRGDIPILNLNHIQNLCERLCHRSVFKNVCENYYSVYIKVGI